MFRHPSKTHKIIKTKCVILHKYNSVFKLHKQFIFISYIQVGHLRFKFSVNSSGVFNLRNTSLNMSCASVKSFSFTALLFDFLKTLSEKVKKHIVTPSTLRVFQM